MSKVDDYRRLLRNLDDWTPFLLKNSGLPGPRGNLELARAFTEEASAQQAEALLAIPLAQAPENTAQVFLVFCGVTSLGKRVASGDEAQFARLRTYASDPRWRIREAVAIALQYAGDASLARLLREMRAWCKGNWYEKRAAAAALAEPRLLKDRKSAEAALSILEDITKAIAATSDRSTDSFRTLRKSLGYCWSVAIVAAPERGKALFEEWLDSTDRDLRWMVKQNLMKNRLVKMDAQWVKACLARIDA